MVSKPLETTDIQTESTNFVNQVNEFITKFNVPLTNVINTDQSGFNYELSPLRSLSFTGEKTTTSHVISMHSASHSYTIQPCITMSGQLLPKLLICLQEPNGEFGPIVRAQLPQYPNVLITCSKSGKMTRELVIQFNNEIIKFYFPKEFVYIVDSWSGHKDLDMYNELFGDNCKLFTIPPHCTPIVQPLDVFFFRFWKLLAKRITNEVILYQWPVDIRSKNSIIKMHSLIHGLLSAPCFQSLICYAWGRSGYSMEIVNFESVIDICFPKNLEICSINECYFPSFICCSNCKSELCFQHFFIDYHIH